MKKILSFLVALIIGFLIFGIVIKIVGLRRVEEAFFLFLSFKGLIIILLTFIIAVISILRWKLILQSQGFNPLTEELKELGKIWVVGFAMSYLTPVALLGGEAFRVYLLKKKFNFKWEKSAASVAIDKILDGTFFLMFLIVGILTFLFYGRFPSKTMAWLVVLIVGGLLGLLLFFYFKALNKKSVLEWFLKLFEIEKEKIKNTTNGKMVFDIEKEIIRFFSPRRKTFWKGLSLSFLKYFLLFLRAAILILFLGEGIGVTKALAVYGFSNFALLFPFPAALGSLETAGILSFKTLGLNMAQGPVFAMVLRGADLILSFIGIFFLLKFALKLTGKKILGFRDK